MDFGKLFELLVDRLYQGGTGALITIFLFIIAYLIIEVRKLKKQQVSLINTHRKERDEFYKLMETMNDKFLKRDDNHIKTMQEVVKESTISSQNIKTVLSNFINFISNSNVFDKEDNPAKKD